MVAPALWGQGIAAELLAGIEGSRNPGPPASAADRAASERNLAYYQRRGYREVARDLDAAGVVVVIMERPTSPRPSRVGQIPRPKTHFFP